MNDAAIGLLEDRAAIHDLVVRYARGVDTRDMELVRSCFSVDCDVSAWGRGSADRDAMIEFIRGVGHFNMTMHMMGNQFIEVDGDSGQVDTYAMLTHHRDGGESELRRLDVSGSRYVERVERRGGEWVSVARGGEPRWAPTGVTAVTTDDAAVRWLLDRAEIHDLLMHYALAVDQRDYDRIRACFATPFRAAYGDRVFEDADALLGFIAGVEHFHSTTHFLGTQLVEVAGDEAWASTASLVTHRPRPDDPDAEWVAAGRYVDHLVRADGRWRIRDRGVGAHAGRPASCPVPATDDERVQRLIDRALVQDEVVRSAIALDEQSAGRTHHLVNNHWILFDGDGAHAEAYVYRVTRDGEGRVSPWGDDPVRWVDAFERSQRGWVPVSRVETTTRVADELVLHPR